MALRNKWQREKDLAEIAHRYLNLHQYQAQIAQDLGFHQSTVSRDLKELTKRWRAAAFMKVDDAKAEELERINRLEVEYWTAWEESKTQTVKVAAKKHGDTTSDAGGAVVQTLRSVELAGNPAFLAGVQWCIEKRCKIFGLDAPVKHDLTFTLAQLIAEVGEEDDGSPSPNIGEEVP